MPRNDERRERRDAAQAADQVEPVGVERRQLAKARADALGGTHDDAGDGDEDERQRQPRRRPAGSSVVK